MKLKLFKPTNNSIKSSTNQLTPKSGVGRNYSVLDILLKNGYNDLASSLALKFYRQAAPVATSINLISDSVSEIKPLLLNTETGEHITDHPFLELLFNPNADSTYQEFMKRIVEYYLITGSSYIEASGSDLRKPPNLINVIQSDSVTPMVGGDGYPDSFNVYLFASSAEYKRKMVKSRFRYFDGTQHELYQIKTFNPISGKYNLDGMSPLQPIALDIEQLIAAGTHNLSLLKRGATILGMFMTDGELTDDQYKRLKAQINQYYTGEDNAGRSFLTEGGLDFKGAQQNNKDMDFLELKKNITSTIFNHLRVPLPLVSEDTMTMANVSESREIFFDNNIIPLTRRIFNDLTIFLMHRYDNSENLVLSFDESKISALAPRRMEALKLQKDLAVLTINELRELIGYSSIEGGDSLYLPSNLVPVAEDTEADSTNA